MSELQSTNKWSLVFLTHTDIIVRNLPTFHFSIVKLKSIQHAHYLDNTDLKDALPNLQDTGWTMMLKPDVKQLC